MIKVRSKVLIMEYNGYEPTKKCDPSEIFICSHEATKDFITIDIDGESFTVSVRDIKAAIDNAVNTA
jgi:hypothetical protein